MSKDRQQIHHQAELVAIEYAKKQSDEAFAKVRGFKERGVRGKTLKDLPEYKDAKSWSDWILSEGDE